MRSGFDARVIRKIGTRPPAAFSSATFADGLIRMAQWSSLLFPFPGGSHLATNLDAPGIHARGIAGEPGVDTLLIASKLDAGDLISQGNVVTFNGGAATSSRRYSSATTTTPHTATMPTSKSATPASSDSREPSTKDRSCTAGSR